jgi:hypothetical protein
LHDVIESLLYDDWRCVAMGARKGIIAGSIGQVLHSLDPLRFRSMEIFGSDQYLRHNQRRREHLASSVLPPAGNRLLVKHVPARQSRSKEGESSVARFLR